MHVIQVEGIRGIGKSTFINYVKERFKNSKNLNVEFVDIPELNWINFKNYFRKSLKENYKNIDVVFMENSLYTHVHCLDELSLDGKLDDSGFHKSIKNTLQKINDAILQPDIIVYFEIDNKDIPLLLQNRILKGKKQGESNISNDYLVKLNNIYNNVINNDYSKKTKIIKYKCNDYFLNITPNTDNSNICSLNNEVIQIFSEIFSEIFLYINK